MAQNSKIEWCDHTFNPWIGCTKVSPGCANCYAEALDKRFHPQGEDGNGFHWGPSRPRKRTTSANWKQPLKWNKKPWICDGCGKAWHSRKWMDAPDSPPAEDVCCGKSYHRARVFCGSLCDWLDGEAPIQWRLDLLDLIRITPNIDWLLLTKRPQNFASTYRQAYDLIGRTNSDLWTWLRDWITGEDIPENVWIGTTVENQEMADKRIPELLKIPAKVRFLSCEPLLGPVDLNMKQYPGPMCRDCADSTIPWICDTDGKFCATPDWVICGGESGPNARPMHPDWARLLRDQCQESGVPFLFKQWGEWAPATEEYGITGSVMPETGVMPCGKKATWIGSDGKIQFPSANGLQRPVMAIARVGKKSAGRLLDGQEHNEFPETN